MLAPLSWHLDDSSWLGLIAVSKLVTASRKLPPKNLVTNLERVVPLCKLGIADPVSSALSLLSHLV